MKKINNFLFGKSNYDLGGLNESLMAITRKHRWKLFFAILISAFFTVVMVNNVRTINKQLVNVRHLEKVEKELKNNNKILTKQISDFESPERIIRISTERLGMKQNSDIPVIIKMYE